MGKIYALSTLLEEVSQLKRDGKRIVLANGVFDILHVGHVSYLQEAARLGDFLIVAVNSDESVKKIKGPLRPLVPERERAEIISMIEGVDAVVIFGESNVESLLRAIKPDVHAKGTDYTKETVPEKDVAKELGIEVAIVGSPKEHSVTEIIERVARKLMGEKAR